MLSVFAIDPGICRCLEWFRYCVEHCQTSRGRAIADLPPGQWCQEALTGINQCVADRELGPVKGQSLKRRLDMARDRLVHRPGTNWDYMEESWTRNAEAEHRRDPFAAVVSAEYTGADDTEKKYHPDELSESVVTWNTPDGVNITRTRGEFTASILPMLFVAEEVHFLDRGFNIDSGSLFTWNYRNIIQEMVRRCEALPAITIHCTPLAEVDGAYFEGELVGIYAPLIPTGKQLTCLMCDVEGDTSAGRHPFHNRYVLTNHCGVMVGYGTDSPREETDAPDTLQIIDKAIFANLLKLSRKRVHPRVKVRKEIVIEGTAR